MSAGGRPRLDQAPPRVRPVRHPVQHSNAWRRCGVRWRARTAPAPPTTRRAVGGGDGRPRPRLARRRACGARLQRVSGIACGARSPHKRARPPRPAAGGAAAGATSPAAPPASLTRTVGGLPSSRGGRRGPARDVGGGARPRRGVRRGAAHTRARVQSARRRRQAPMPTAGLPPRARTAPVQAARSVRAAATPPLPPLGAAPHYALTLDRRASAR